MNHTCHWPGCQKEVPPKLWGCKPHWFMLPKRLRDAIWRTYVPGQENTKNPSPEYVAIAREVLDWISNRNEVKEGLKCRNCKRAADSGLDPTLCSSCALLFMTATF